jgi:ABC-type multidrug transport system ATPase subunit
MEILTSLSPGTLKVKEKVLFQYPPIEIYKGFLYFLVGKSGSGKTLFFEFLVNVLSQKGISFSYMPQYYQNIFLDTSTVRDFFIDMEPNRVLKTKKLLSLFGLNWEKLIRRKVIELSTGMQQRFILSLALSLDSEIYLLDEPFSNIDKETSKKILSHIVKESDTMKKTFFLIMHEVEYLQTLRGLPNVKVLYIDPRDRVLKTLTVEEFINKTSLGECMKYFL